MHINLIDRIDITWTGRIWNRKVIVTIHPPGGMNSKNGIQTHEVEDGMALSLVASDVDGLIGFLRRSSDE